MKTRLFALLWAGILFCACGTSLYAQSLNDFGSAGTGNWGTDATNWKQWDGSGWNTTPSGAPTASDNVWILTGHVVTAEATGKTCNNLNVQTGGKIITTSNDTTNYITISGTLTLEGTGYWQQGGQGPFVAAAAFSFSSTSTFEFNGTKANSTCTLPNTSYGNLIWGNLSNVGLHPSFALTINGNLTIQNAGKIRGTGTTTGYTHTVGGNVIVNETTTSNIGLSGVNGAVATVVWNIGGNLDIQSGKVTGLESLGATTSSATYNIAGNVSIGANGTLQYGSNGANAGPVAYNIKGDVTNSGVISKNSGAAGGTYLISFDGTSGVQMFSGNSPAASTNVVCDFRINNASGVTLSSPLTLNTNWRVNLTSGNLNTSSVNLLTVSTSGGAGMVGGSSSSFVNGPMAFTWATSTATKSYPIGKGSAYRPLDITLTTPASPVISAEVFNANAGGTHTGLDAISVIRYYQTSLVSGTATSGGTVMITFGGDDGVTGGQEGNLVVAQCATVNGDYGTLGQTTNTATSVTSSSYDPALGDFLLLGSTGGNALPVEVASFVAQASRRGAVLCWSTASEVNNYGFDIERRVVADVAANWSKVGFVAGAGNSTSAREYSYSDENVLPGRYAYRLKQINHDGSSQYFGAAEVVVGTAPKEFSLGNYPNPFNPATVIEFSVPVDGHAVVKVFSIAGEELAKVFDDQVSAGRFYQASFDGARLSSGVYYYTLHSAGQRLVGRMLLVK